VDFMSRGAIRCSCVCLVIWTASTAARSQAFPGSIRTGTQETQSQEALGRQQQARDAAKLPASQKEAPHAEPRLPDAPSESARLTPHQKFETFVKRTYSPYTFASAAFNATWAQMWGDWDDYGGGMQGWGKRFGASLANTQVRSFFSSFALPVVFHQDPRYHPSRKHGFFPRVWYAGTRTIVTRSDAETPMFNYSEVFGVLFTSSIQNAYYPSRDRGLNETAERFIGGIGSDATSNMFREFSPELKRIARKVIPKRARKLEQRLPSSMRKMGSEGAE
jgi:hypothetical protein